MRDIPAELVSELASRGDTVGCAESLTGGLLSDAWVRVPGASAVFRGGIVGYATDVKRSLLKVTTPLVISGECALQMARGVAELLQVSWGLATTGVAGPEKQEGQPVGTVFAAIVGPGQMAEFHWHIDGSRPRIRQECTRRLLTQFHELLLRDGTG